MQRLVYLVLIAVVLSTTAIAAEPNFPALTGRVVDGANLLSTADEAQLTRQLEEHERSTTNQVVVVTLPSLQGYSIEDFGYRLGRHWGVGQEGKDNGVLLIVAPKERKVRIEVGYGLESALTDSLSKIIIESHILPKFRANDFPAGIHAGVVSILKAIGGTYDWSEPAQQRKPGSRIDSNDALSYFLLAVLILGCFGLLFLMHEKIGGAPTSRPHGKGYRFEDGTYYRRHHGHGGGGGGGFSGGGGGFSGGGGGFGGGGGSGSW